MEKVPKIKIRCILTLGLAGLITLSPMMTYGKPNEETKLQRPSDWAASDLYDAEVCGILPLDWQKNLHKVVNKEQMSYIHQGLEGKLKQLNMYKARQMEQKNIVTRGDVLVSYYEFLKQYNTDIDMMSDAITYMKEAGVISGETEAELKLDKPCTLQEAVVFANRFLEDLYTKLGAGSKGFLWEVSNEGRTVYLLGTIHLGKENLYPFNQTLDTIIEDADKVAFEVDFNDQRGQAYLLQKQMYMEDATLNDVIEPELYEDVIQVMKELGVPEEQAKRYKPWALANTFVVLAGSSENELITTNLELPAIDYYIYNKALIEEKEILELEGYVFQADLLDSIPIAIQIESLEQGIDVMKSDGIQTNESVQAMNTWTEYFREGDIEGFTESYAKDLALDNGDEMTTHLFGKRDDYMTAKIIEYLTKGDEGTYLVVVGAGHMIGETGIVHELNEAGYSVKVVQ